MCLLSSDASCFNSTARSVFESVYQHQCAQYFSCHHLKNFWKHWHIGATRLEYPVMIVSGLARCKALRWVAFKYYELLDEAAATCMRKSCFLPAIDFVCRQAFTLLAGSIFPHLAMSISLITNQHFADVSCKHFSHIRVCRPLANHCACNGESMAQPLMRSDHLRPVGHSVDYLYSRFPITFRSDFLFISVYLIGNSPECFIHL